MVPGTSRRFQDFCATVFRWRSWRGVEVVTQAGEYTKSGYCSMGYVCAEWIPEHMRDVQFHTPLPPHLVVCVPQEDWDRQDLDRWARRFVMAEELNGAASALMGMSSADVTSHGGSMPWVDVRQSYSGTGSNQVSVDIHAGSFSY